MSLPRQPSDCMRLLIGSALLLMILAGFLISLDDPEESVSPIAVVSSDSREPLVPIRLNSITDSQETSAESVGSIWQMAGSHDSDSLPALRDDIVDAALVDYDRNQLIGLDIGDFINVLIPQIDQRLLVEISSSELLPSGNTSIKGRLVSNSLFSFVMTIGEHSMFVTVGTDKGIYNVIGNGTLAWVIPAKSLKSHINPAVMDYRSTRHQLNK